MRWNVARRRAQGERFLRMAGAADVAEARTLWKDPNTPVYRRCLAARANGLLEKHGPSWMVEGADMDDHDSPLARARDHGTSDAHRRQEAERRLREREEAAAKMRELGAGSVSEVVAILQDRSHSPEKRITAAAVLGGLKCRDAVRPLIETLAEGHQMLSWTCMDALTRIGSRRHARRLMEIVRGDYPLPARQEAVYTLWRLREVRAEQLFIHVGAAVEKEEWYTRDMATEALGNTCGRPASQIALFKRLFDPCVSVRYAALCACPSHSMLECLRRAIEAKLSDPDRVDDHRVIAELAAQILGSADSPASCGVPGEVGKDAEDN
jgi:HEAT repeat protein